MFDLRIDYPDAATQVVVRPGVLGDCARLLRDMLSPSPPVRSLLVTDATVWPLYGQGLLDSLAAEGFAPQTHIIEPGEASKSLGELSAIYDSLLRCGLDRQGLIVALGGGVVSDLAGFAAATWMRGVRWAVCPTTLEADIDASIGGKTAVNLPGGKNLVGAFHHPVGVVVDPSCLGSLDVRDIRAGLAESVKHALIASEPFFAWHEANVAAVLALNEPALTELILQNLGIKAEVVRADPYERTGRRMWLNLGHTIGHAIEDRCTYALRHGECVGLGLLAAARLSHAMGMLDAAVVDRTVALLERIGLPIRLPKTVQADIQVEDIVATMRRDKKVQAGRARFVLLEAIGRPVVRDDVPEDLVRAACRSLIA